MFQYQPIGPRVKQLKTLTDHYLRHVFEELELTPTQSRILGYLITRQTQPCCPRDVEETFSLTHPTVSGILSRLEEKGFVTFRTDGNDRRCKRIEPTEKARVVHAQVIDAFDRMEAQMMEGFAPEEWEQFSVLLNRVICNLGGAPCHFPKEELP